MFGHEFGVAVFTCALPLPKLNLLTHLIAKLQRNLLPLSLIYSYGFYRQRRSTYG